MGIVEKVLLVLTVLTVVVFLLVVYLDFVRRASRRAWSCIMEISLTDRFLLGTGLGFKEFFALWNIFYYLHFSYLLFEVKYFF